MAVARRRCAAPAIQLPVQGLQLGYTRILDAQRPTTGTLFGTRLKLTQPGWQSQLQRAGSLRSWQEIARKETRPLGKRHAGPLLRGALEARYGAIDRGW